MAIQGAATWESLYQGAVFEGGPANRRKAKVLSLVKGKVLDNLSGVKHGEFFGSGDVQTKVSTAETLERVSDVFKVAIKESSEIKDRINGKTKLADGTAVGLRGACMKNPCAYLVLEQAKSEEQVPCSAEYVASRLGSQAFHASAALCHLAYIQALKSCAALVECARRDMAAATKGLESAQLLRKRAKQ